MSLISVTDFIKWTGRLFTETDWDSNVDATVSALNSVATGKDIAVPTITTNQVLGDAISNDPTLSDNSATVLPTQQAVKTYVDNNVGDSVGTVKITSNAGNISTTFTKASTHKILRFAFSGSALGNVAGSVVLAIGGVTQMTWTVQGAPVTFATATAGGGQFASVQNTNASGAGGNYMSVAGATGASNIAMSSDTFDITGEPNGSLAIAVTFTNITNPSAAIYRNRVG